MIDPNDTSIEYVEWIDSATCPGWLSSDTIESCVGIAMCKTVGFKVKEDADMLVLALNAGMGNTSPYGETISIPKVCIKKRYTLQGA